MIKHLKLKLAYKGQLSVKKLQIRLYYSVYLKIITFPLSLQTLHQNSKRYQWLLIINK